MKKAKHFIEKKHRIEICTRSKVHFIGVGGIGMSALAKICIEKNIPVSGSDVKESSNTVRLKNLGAQIYINHQPSNIRGAHFVVVSGAIPKNNAEYQSAVDAQIPILKRAELLAFLMDLFPKKIAVTGTHGKSTTTSMITCILDLAKRSPTYLIGANLNDYAGNAALGTGKYFVAEADESDGSFLITSPNIGVVTNIEQEHMNFFVTKENLLDHFKKFMEIPICNNGYLVLNQDDQNIQLLTQHLNRDQLIFYSLNDPSADLFAKKIKVSEKGTSYQLYLKGEAAGAVFLQVHGVHNAHNSLAAIGVGLRENIAIDTIIDSLSKFSGIKRRLQLIGEVSNIRVYDDYGHHPTEIQATLKAVKESFKRRIVCIFQPHRYSRTQSLLTEFSESFEAADHVIITEIYSASEEAIPGFSAQSIVHKMEKQHPCVQFVLQKSDVPGKLIDVLKPYDVVITMGAGDIFQTAKELVNRLKKKYLKS